MKMINKIQNRQNGQIILILVLLTIVAVTIGLSLVSRTIQDVRISSQIEQSSRAFSAAEAGVENALKYSNIGNFTGNVSIGGANSTYQYTVAQVGGGSGAGYTVVPFGVTNPNESRTIWLVNHDSSGNIIESRAYPLGNTIDICWNNDAPGIIATLYYKDGANYHIVKKAYKAAGGYNFISNVSYSNLCGSGLNRGKTITVTNNGPDNDNISLVASANSIPIMVKVQVIGASTSLAVRSSVAQAFPNQGKQITSVGQSQTGVLRKIQVIQGYKSLPALLDFALYSQ